VTIKQGWKVYLRPSEYKVKDPRAILLQKLMRELADSLGSISPLFETALALEEACEESLAPKGIYPNVDFYSGILYREIGIPPVQFTSLFAIARPVGWRTGVSRFLKTGFSGLPRCIPATSHETMSLRWTVRLSGNCLFSV